MAITFHEGLPGSGKSYEAMVNKIIPQLRKGRKVFSNIKGMNHERVAEAADLPLDVVQSLLVQIKWEDTPRIYDLVENDSYVVIDELQDFYPTNRKPLDHKTTEFITQHRHRGLDILTMGQSLKDCHATWRRRVDEKFFFLNRSGIGRPDQYKWESYKQTSSDKFEKITSGGGKYDPKFFGTYASHNAGVEVTTQESDPRSNLFNRKIFKLGIPVAIVGTAFAVYSLLSFFTKPSMVKTETIKTHKAQAPARVEAKPKPAQGHHASEESPPVSKPQGESVQSPLDFVQDLFQKSRPRLTGYLESADKVFAIFDFYTPGGELLERLDSNQLLEMGYQVTIQSNFAIIYRPDGFSQRVSTAWPRSTGDRQQAAFHYPTP